MRIFFLLICLQLNWVPLFAQKSYFKIGLDYGFVNSERDVRKHRSTVEKLPTTEPLLIYPSLNYVYKNNWELSLQHQYFDQQNIYMDNVVMYSSRYVKSFDLMLNKNIIPYINLPNNQFFSKSNIWVGAGFKYLIAGSYSKWNYEDYNLTCDCGNNTYPKKIYPTLNLSYSFELTKWLQARGMLQHTLIRDYSNFFIAQLGIGFKI